jgi:hypothetical protein
MYRLGDVEPIQVTRKHRSDGGMITNLGSHTLNHLLVGFKNIPPGLPNVPCVGGIEQRPFMLHLLFLLKDLANEFATLQPGLIMFDVTLLIYVLCGHLVSEGQDEIA